MAPIQTRTVDLRLTSLAFLIIVASTLTAESICHVFLRSEPSALETHHILIGSATALFATLLIVSLFLRNRQLTKEIGDKELLRAKKDWEKTFNTMTDFVSVHDKDYKVIKANQALCEFLGKSPEEILGKFCFQLFHDLDRPYTNCPHLKTTETAHPVSEIITDPNIGVPLQITCSPFFDDNGSFQGSLHIARISPEVDRKRKNAEEIFPICASCKSIRDRDNRWLPLEDYFIKKHEFQFTHTVCNICRDKLYPEYIKL